MSEEYRLQDPGEGITEAEIVNLYIEPGQAVKEDDILLDVETDKAVVEVPSPFSGTVDEVRIKQGELAKVGDVLFTYTSSDSISAKTGTKPAEKVTQMAKAGKTGIPQEQTPPQQEIKALKGREEKERVPVTPSHRKHPPIPAAPSTRRLARELGVELEAIVPSGPHGRVTADDVRAFTKRPESQKEGKRVRPAPPPTEQDTYSHWGEVERVPLQGLRRKVAEHMAKTWHTIPHVTHQLKADITALETLRQRHKDEVKEVGGHLTLTVFAIKAVIAALKQFPRFNASLDESGENLVMKHYYHIGVAVDTDEGLLVPVLHDADRKDIIALSVELDELVKRARAGELKLEEMSGGSFTITNPGMLGGDAFTPLIHYPEAAILGMAAASLEPVIQGSLEDFTITPRLILPLCLAFDHRINDGADAARFANAIAAAMADPEQLLLKV